MNRFLYFLLCIVIGWFLAVALISNKSAIQKILFKSQTIEKSDYQAHPIQEQIIWALCYVRNNSNHMEDVEFKCPDPELGHLFYRQVVSVLNKASTPDMRWCANSFQLDRIIVLIGEKMYINYSHIGSFGVTKDTAIPTASSQICKKLYTRYMEDS